MGKFTMIPMNNDDFYSKDNRLNILHLYIVERVRGFEKMGLTCYMSNEQFAQETNSSVSTIKRSIKLLLELNILWAGYHQESVKNKKRVLRIYNEKLGVQNEPQRGSNCTDERFKMNLSEVQNEPLVYQKNIKENHKYIDKIKILFDEDTQEDIDMGLSSKEDWEKLCLEVFAEEIRLCNGDCFFKVEGSTLYCMVTEHNEDYILLEYELS